MPRRLRLTGNTDGLKRHRWPSCRCKPSRPSQLYALPKLGEFCRIHGEETEALGTEACGSVGMTAFSNTSLPVLDPSLFLQTLPTSFPVNTCPRARPDLPHTLLTAGTSLPALVFCACWGADVVVSACTAAKNLHAVVAIAQQEDTQGLTRRGIAGIMKNWVNRRQHVGEGMAFCRTHAGYRMNAAHKWGGRREREKRAAAPEMEGTLMRQHHLLR